MIRVLRGWGCTCSSILWCRSRLFVDVVGMVGSMKATFFVDIDQTISTGYIGRDLAESIAHYRERGVCVPDSIESWPALFQLPDVARQHEALPGAQAGVLWLAAHGEIFYATARKSDVYEITRAWLAAHGFPRSDQVIFVEGVAEKLVVIAGHPGSLVLVDDRWRQILDLLEKYGKRRALAGLLDRLILVAFGAGQADVPASPAVPVVPLSEWSLVTDVLVLIHKDVSLKRG